MNAHPAIPENANLFARGVLPKAEVLPIFQPLSEEQVQVFGEKLDIDLAKLEEKFASFTTAKVMRSSFGR